MLRARISARVSGMNDMLQLRSPLYCRSDTAGAYCSLASGNVPRLVAHCIMKQVKPSKPGWISSYRTFSPLAANSHMLLVLEALAMQLGVEAVQATHTSP